MERFLLNSEDYQQHYDICGNFSVNSIPLTARQNIPLGVFFLTVGLIELVGLKIINFILQFQIENRKVGLLGFTDSPTRLYTSTPPLFLFEPRFFYSPM